MSTLHLTAPPTLKRRARLTTAIATLAVLVAIATAAIILASRSTNATHVAPSVASANETSAAYAPPHVPVKIRASSHAPAGGITANNQDSPAYTKAEFYTKVR